LYVFGVARNVKRAYYGSTERAVRRWAPLPEPSEELFDKERQDACLQECLRTLDPEDRRLLTAYYQDEKRKKIDRRRELAEEERLTAAALRKKIQRLRDRLLDCLQRCYNRTRDEPQP
jgi:hypothetical protein